MKAENVDQMRSAFILYQPTITKKQEIKNNRKCLRSEREKRILLSIFIFLTFIEHGWTDLDFFFYFLIR